MKTTVPLPPRAALVLALLLASATAANGGEVEIEMRGVWMHATQIKTPAETAECVAQITSARLNAVFVLVWYWGGQAFFRSDHCPMGDGVTPGHDPLGALVEACHERGIEVHAWFVNGAYGASTPRHVLDRHPDWAVDSRGGELWYDFGKPAVRAFQRDLMLECLSRYDVDGNVYFSLHHLSEELAANLATGPHVAPARAYRPPARGPTPPTAPSRRGTAGGGAGSVPRR